MHGSLHCIFKITDNESVSFISWCVLEYQFSFMKPDITLKPEKFLLSSFYLQTSSLSKSNPIPPQKACIYLPTKGNPQIRKQ